MQKLVDQPGSIFCQLNFDLINFVDRLGFFPLPSQPWCEHTWVEIPDHTTVDFAASINSVEIIQVDRPQTQTNSQPKQSTPLPILHYWRVEINNQPAKSTLVWTRYYRQKFLVTSFTTMGWKKTLFSWIFSNHEKIPAFAGPGSRRSLEKT